MADAGYERSAPARPYYLESVDNALRLVLLLARRGSVSVSDAARELGLAPSTTHRLLSTMRYRGFAVQSADRTYQPGPAMADLWNAHSSSQALLAVALPHLRWLQQQLDETCHLVVRHGREVRFLASVEAEQPLRVTARTGTVLPAHLTSGGKVLLGDLPAAEFDRLYPSSGVPALGLGPDELPAVKRDLNATRKRKYGLNRGESERGIVAVGMPVHSGGRAVAAISVSVPSVRYSPARLREMLPVIRAAAAAIDAELGNAPQAGN
jgi:DNA-binding IclR family transcriptional regulator